MNYDDLRGLASPMPSNRALHRLYICSPLSSASLAEVEANMQMARHYMEQVGTSLGCRSYAPHAFLPYLLDDSDPDERKIALQFGIMLLELCDGLVVCGKRITSGMLAEIEHAKDMGIPILLLEAII